MAARAPLDPRHLAPFFVLAALLHALAIASRFDEVARQLPPLVASSVLLASVAMLFVEGYFEGRLDYGPTLAELPLWMRIKSGPVKAAFTFAFTYLAIVALQTWDVEIGPIDPTPPPEWSLAQRAQWFGMFTFGMFFVNYLAATSILIPVFRALTTPLRALPGIVGVAIASVVGVAAGWGLSELVASLLLKDRVAAGQDAWAQLTAAPMIAIPIALTVTIVPILVGLVADAREDRREAG
ncbi:hypothetical protein ACNOYE_24805 [Nannocystaceae bacterium ST9]